MQAEHSTIHAIILAAGKGTRMRSAKPKVLHPVLGRSMLSHVLDTAEALLPAEIAIVVGHQSELVRQAIGQATAGLQWVEQAEQLGTGHAVKQCADIVDASVDHVLILCADTPLLRSSHLRACLRAHEQADAAITVMSAELENPHGYGRIVRDEQGAFQRIVEQRDATEQEASLSEVNSGVFFVKRKYLFDLLSRLDCDNDQAEWYLTDIVALALADGLSVQAVAEGDCDDVMGINDRIQLAKAEAVMQKRIVHDWQLRGVSFEHAETIRVEASVSLGVDTVVKAGSQLLGATHIGDACVLGPYAIIEDAWLDDGVQIEAFTHIQQARVGADAMVGPFARLRPQAELDEQVKIGNFCEVKKSVIGRGSKVNHLSYIGDTHMGADCNIGAGSITCNYDGANKHQTVLGDRVFVGSNCKLIAPVSVGNDATLGAGSIISKNVVEGGLTLSARPDQRHLASWKRPKKDQT